MVDAYSITESMNAAIIQPDHEAAASGDRRAGADVELQIVGADGDPAAARDLPPNAEGGLVIRAPQLMEATGAGRPTPPR